MRAALHEVCRTRYNSETSRPVACANSPGIRQAVATTSSKRALLVPSPLRPPRHLPRATLEDGDGSESSDDISIEAARAKLTASWEENSNELSGQELWDMVRDKFGASFDVRLVRRGRVMYLHIMWKYLEMKSFPLTPQEYLLQLEAVCAYLNAWGCADLVRQEIEKEKKGPGIGPGGARAVQVRLPVDASNVREF